MVPKLQSLTLLFTKRAVLLVPCIVLIFFTKSQNNLNYLSAKKHSTSKPDNTFKHKLCYQEFPGVYDWRQHKNTQHGFFIKSANVDLDDIINEVDDTNLKEELTSCLHFSADSDLERARQKKPPYAVENLNTTIVDEELYHFFSNLRFVAKVMLVFGFILNYREDGGFWWFYAHENNTLVDWFKLVCTKEGLTELWNFLDKIDVIES